MSTKFAILGLLNVKPMHGYEIKQVFERTVSYAWSMNYGQLYPLLKKLEHEGLIVKETVAQENHPDKKVYTITNIGKHEFHRWLSEPALKLEVRDEFYLKFMFLSFSDGDTAVRLLHKQIEVVEDRYTHLLGVKKEHGGSMDMFLALYLEAGIMRFETDLRWLRLCQEKIKEKFSLGKEKEK